MTAANLRHANGQFRPGTLVPIADLDDIEAPVNDPAGYAASFERWMAGEVPPPLDIVVDPAGKRALAKGHRRLAAARAAHKAGIEAAGMIPIRTHTMGEEFGKSGDAAPPADVPRVLVPIDEANSYPPFPVDHTFLARLRPDQVPRFYAALTDRETLPRVTVKLNSLIATQNRVSTAKATAMVGQQRAGPPPAVVKVGGREYIADGHHGLTSAWLEGRDEMEVGYKDLEAVSNVLKAVTEIPDGQGGVWSIPVTIAKANEPDPAAETPEYLVFGWANIVTVNGQYVVDSQGDWIDVEELERVSYAYIENGGIAGDSHKKDAAGNPLKFGVPVESVFLSKKKQELMGIPDLGFEGWWAGWRVTPEVHAKVVSGQYAGLSIGGKGVRIAAAPPATTEAPGATA